VNRKLLTVAALVMLAACGDTNTPFEVTSDSLEPSLAYVAADFTASVESIEALRTTLDGVTWTGRNTDRSIAGLNRKLDGARDKLTNVRKAAPADAIQKLMDFRAKVIALRDASKPTLSQRDTYLLISGAEAVILEIALAAHIDPPVFD